MRFILALISIEVAGLAFILLAIRRAGDRRPPAELFTVSFFAGLGVISLQIFFYNLLNIELTLRNVIIVPIALLIFLFARYAGRPRRPSGQAPEGAARPWSRTEKLLACGILLQFLWIVLQVIPHPVHSHDAVANYALKARMFYLGEGIPQGFFAMSESTVAHPDYPLLLPFLMTWIYEFTGFNDLTVNMVMPVVYAVFLILFYSQLSRFFNRAYCLLMIFFLATVPQFADYATIMYADLLLCALVTCAFTFFIIYTRGRDRGYLFTGAILTGVSLWLKNEAVVFAAALFAVMGVFLIRSRGQLGTRTGGDIVKAVCIVIGIALPQLIVKLFGTTVNSDINIAQLSPERIMQNVKDIPVLFNLFQQEVFGPKKWNIFWVMFFAAIIWKRRSLWRGDCYYVTLFLVISFLGYFAGYMATTGNNLFFYVNTTISRFMIHFCGIALLLIAYLMRGDVCELESFRDAG